MIGDFCVCVCNKTVIPRPHKTHPQTISEKFARGFSQATNRKLRWQLSSCRALNLDDLSKGNRGISFSHWFRQVTQPAQSIGIKLCWYFHLILFFFGLVWFFFYLCLHMNFPFGSYREFISVNRFSNLGENEPKRTKRKLRRSWDKKIFIWLEGKPNILTVYSLPTPYLSLSLSLSLFVSCAYRALCWNLLSMA